MNYRIIYRYFCSFLLVLLFGCNNENNTSNYKSIIPIPAGVEVSATSAIDLNAPFTLQISDINDISLQSLANNFIQQVDRESKVKAIVAEETTSTNSQFIYLELLDLEGPKETYNLTIKDSDIRIKANSYHGLFNGLQTLRQLFFLNKNEGESTLANITINDVPQYSYRGLMLDVSRHFFTVDEIKKTIDLMSLYKMNTLHWHLTDDQGWRIEIEKYPLLTSIGAYRVETQLEKNVNPLIGDGIAHDGFYTQDDIKEIVEYARQRYVTVIPEIDMPGHMQAALAAYPELACNEGPYTVSTRWGVHNDILCPSEFTFAFMEDVLLEVINLFPSNYIHIGGDEVPTTRWKTSEIAQQVINNTGLASEHELQGYFYQRIADFLQQYGKKAIGWDEIQEKGLTSPTTVMAWRGLEHGELAIKNGHQVILNPSSHTYLNYYQGDRSQEPLAQCCLVTLEQVYNLPIKYEHLTDEENKKILGAQGSLWTEYISSQSHLEYMLMPRMMALSEVLWSDKTSKNYSMLLDKLPLHFKYLDSINVNYHPLSD